MKIGAYLENVAAAALICGVVLSISGSKGAFHGIIKLLTGIFLVIAIVQPVLKMEIPSTVFFSGVRESEYRKAVEDGKLAAQKAMEAGIQERTAAYIQDEAKKLNCNLTVEVTLNQNIPVGIVLEGAVSPYAKSSLSQWIAQNLNIPPEEQQWIG